MVKNGYYSFIRPTTEAFEKLRVLMSNRESIVKRSVSAANQIYHWVDIIFPELKQVFKDLTCKGALATLQLFPTQRELRSMEAIDIVKGWRSVMKRQPGIKKAEALIRLAKNSVGNEKAHEAYKLHLKQLIEEYDLATSQLEIVDIEVSEALENITFTDNLLGIKGLTKVMLGGILGESGDLSKFAHGNCLLRHAGLHLVEASSGK